MGKKQFWFLVCIAAIASVTSCRKGDIAAPGQQVSASEESSMQAVQQLAHEYGYTVTEGSANAAYTAGSASEAESVMADMEDFLSTTHNASFGQVSSEQKKKNDQLLLKSQEQPQETMMAPPNDPDDPPRTYSVTFYFDQPWPSANYSTTVTWTVGSTGTITSATVTTSTWGYGIYGSYSQVSSYTNIYNNTITFNATGNTSTSIGVGNYTLKNDQGTYYQGWVSTNPSGSPSGGVAEMGPAGPNTPQN